MARTGMRNTNAVHVESRGGTKADNMKTREQHLEWCKVQAREYLAEGDLMNAVTSMMSDLEKHPETAIRGDATLLMVGIFAINSGDPKEVSRFIEGFR